MRRFPECMAVVFVFFGFIFLHHMYERVIEKGVFSIFDNMQVDSLQCLSNKNRIHFHAPDFYRVSEKTSLRLIVAYMRGGSTLLADVVRQAEGDFYMFEPLHGISQTLGNTTQFLNGTKRVILRGERESLYPELLYHWFTCNFDQIDLSALTDPFISIHTPELQEYYKCTVLNLNKSKSTIDSVKRCVYLLHNRCMTARSRTIKTIRLSMFMAGKLLKWLPNLRIIYLVRDPRGILNSQFEQHVTEEKRMFTTVKKVCNSIISDLSHTKELQLCHKSRIMSIIYENLCQYPFKVVPKIYSFLNKEFTNTTKKYIKRIMNGPVKKCHYCTDRGNALGNAYRWIRAMEEKTLIIIDLYCSFLFPLLGYKHLNYDELNTTFVSWMPFE
ncbi:carbohydrate sulfotransferase 1-like isoform X1 [Saccostrea cucullata]|uniref:carbohydrate sulfotransferase 1-like isoform X1 n=1 Tax=Saccostrea cuccullata TaxID=36930 RepID=UPI002ED2474F